MIVKVSVQISVRTVWLTTVHVFIVLYVELREILIKRVHRRETSRD